MRSGVVLESDKIVYPCLSGNELEYYYSLQENQTSLLDLSPETILAEVYRNRVTYQTFNEKDQRNKRNAVIAYAHSKIFPGDESEHVPSIILNPHEKRLVDRVIDRALSLHHRLEKDVYNSRIENDSQGITIEEFIQKFNEYTINKKWPMSGRVHRTIIGRTTFSSLEFKNWLIHQPCFQNLVNLRKHTKNSHVMKAIDELLHKIYTANDDTWLKSPSQHNSDLEVEGFNSSQSYDRESEIDNPILGDTVRVDRESEDESTIKNHTPSDFYQYNQIMDQIYTVASSYQNNIATKVLDKNTSSENNVISDDDDVISKNQKLISVYIDPPQEIFDYSSLEERDEAVIDIDKELFNKHKNRVFLGNNTLYQFSKQNDQYSLKKLNVKNATLIKDLFHDYHRPLTLPQTIFDNMINKIANNNEITAQDNALINRYKSNTWQCDNDYFTAISQLQEKLTGITNWKPSRRTMHQISFTKKLDTNNLNKTTLSVPTPIKNMMDKLDKVHTPTHDLAAILREIAGLSLLESTNHHNTHAEKEFYGVIADLIDLETTFQCIKDEIIKQFGADINSINSPGVKQIYHLCNDNEQLPSARLIALLRLAKDKKGQFLKNIIREKKTIDLYNNIEKYLVLKEGPQLTKTMQTITSDDAFIPNQDVIFDRFLTSLDNENTKQIASTWKEKMLRQSLLNLGFPANKNDFKSGEAIKLQEELSKNIFSYGTIPLFDTEENPHPTAENVEISEEQELKNQCRTFFKYLLAGQAFCLDNINLRLFNAMFSEKDPAFLKAFRECMQEILIDLYNKIQSKAAIGLNEYEEKHITMQIANLLAIYTFFDPFVDTGKPLRVPQKVAGVWQLIDFTIVPIQLDYDEELKPLFQLENGEEIDNDHPIYSYVLKPHNQNALPYLLFMGTPPDACQGFDYATLSDFKLVDSDGRRCSVGETLYATNRKKIKDVLDEHINQVIVAGQSLGGILALLFALDRPHLCEKVYALNPPGLESATYRHGFGDNQQWDFENCSPEERKNKVFVLIQERDLVDEFQIGQWHSDFNLVKLHIPDPLTVPLLGHFLAHLRTFSNVPGSIALHTNTERDNKKRASATFRPRIKTLFLDPLKTRQTINKLETKKEEKEEKIRKSKLTSSEAEIRATYSGLK